MADNRRGGGRGYPPPRDARDLSREELENPPPPGEEDDPRAVPPPFTMNRGPMTLPSIQDTYATYAPTPSFRPYPPPSAPSAPPADSRAVLSYAQPSPPNANGFPAPPPPPPHQFPPPTGHPTGDPRQLQQRPDYHAQQQRRPPYDPYGYNQFPPGPPPPYNGYDLPRVSNGVAPHQAQAAPRQRTSIACRYCRKRKIRCSGYQNTNNGKCNNCDKLRIECIFQPVSSNTSTAFVPVSALQGGVPPGTPLYGAYGQPLAPAAGAQPGHGPPRNGQYATSPHEMSLASPTGTSFSPAPFDERSDPGRRRVRLADEERPLRLPPPNSQQDDDVRRRSPASNPSSGTPPTGYHSFPPGSAPYETDPGQQPPRGGSGVPSGTTVNSVNPMSLNSLMGPDPRTQSGPPPSDIDQGMLGRLNRRNRQNGEGPSPGGS